jgi:hypothetical protein
MMTETGKMKKIAVFISTLQLILSGCLTSPFRITVPEYIFKSDKIAVISGLDDKISAYLADELSKELTAKTTFNVMPSEEITKKVPGYPVKIQGPYSSAYFGIDEDYAATDKKRIKAIQSMLDVDYIYVLWAPSVVQHPTTGRIHFITQLFEFPSSGEVAHAKYYIEYENEAMNSDSRSCLAAFTPRQYQLYIINPALSMNEPKAMYDEIKNIIGRAVREIIKETGKGRPYEASLIKKQ